MGQPFQCVSPCQIVKLAVYGMLPKNLHRRTMMQRLHIFPEEVSALVSLSRRLCWRCLPQPSRLMEDGRRGRVPHETGIRSLIQSRSNILFDRCCSITDKHQHVCYQYGATSSNVGSKDLLGGDSHISNERFSIEGHRLPDVQPFVFWNGWP